MIKTIAMCSILFFQFSCGENTEQANSTSEPEKIVTIEAVEPDVDLHLALEAFASKDYKKSEEYILKAAKTMEPVAALATGKQKESIQNSIAELRDLADNVAIDHVNGIRDLNYFFSRAGHALAGYKVYITETDITNHDLHQIGEDLARAVDRIEANMKYYDREITVEERSSLDNARILAERLEHGELVTDEQIRKDLDNLKIQVKKWDDEFGNRK